MTIKLEQDEGRITQEELDFFYKGNIALEKSRSVEQVDNFYVFTRRRRRLAQHICLIVFFALD